MAEPHARRQGSRAVVAAVLGAWTLAGGGLPAQVPPSLLDNAHVRVTRNAAPCAAAGDGCGRRILVALGDVEIPRAERRRLTRGDVVVFPAGQAYAAPAQGDYLEVNIKRGRPPIASPDVILPPDKNTILHQDDDFFIFEEKLDPGDTRARHSHRERVVIVLNETRLQQWPDGAPELLRNQVPDDVRFNPPVVHVVKTIGKRPLRNIVIEFTR